MLRYKMTGIINNQGNMFSNHYLLLPLFLNIKDILGVQLNSENVLYLGKEVVENNHVTYNLCVDGGFDNLPCYTLQFEYLLHLVSLTCGRPCGK
jgi:hypothetical protein